MAVLNETDETQNWWEKDTPVESEPIDVQTDSAMEGVVESDTQWWSKDQEVAPPTVATPTAEAPEGAFWEADAPLGDTPTQTTGLSTQGAAYGPSALLEGEKYAVVDKFLRDRLGDTELRNYSRQDKVDKYLNMIRSFESGNVPRTVMEINHILSTTEEGRASYGEGMKLFKGLSGITSEEYTWGESLDAVGDYVWSAVADPTNLAGPLVARFFVGAGAKGAAKGVTLLAEKAVVKSLASGASQATARRLGNKVWSKGIQEIGTRSTFKEVVKHAAVSGAVDSAVAVGADVAYQRGMILTDVQDDYSQIQSGLAAIGGLVGAGVSVGVSALKGTSKLPLAGAVIKDMSVTKEADLKGVLKSLTAELDKVPEERMLKYIEPFKDKVARGDELELLDTDFFRGLITGNVEDGYKGLAHSLNDAGFSWVGPRTKDDNFTNWMADAMKNAPKDEVDAFISSFQKRTGIKLTGIEGEPIARIADLMSKKVSQGGQILKATSEAARVLGVKSGDSITADQYADYVFGNLGELATDTIGDRIAGVGSKLEGKIGEISAGQKYTQDLYIRLLTSHPGTSILNIKGWGFKSAGQSAADLLHGTIVYGGATTIAAISGRKGAMNEGWSQLLNTYKANGSKMRNLVDPEMTYTAYKSLVDRDPKAFDKLLSTLPMGVEKNLQEMYGVTPNVAGWMRKTDKAADYIAALSLVKSQDAFTKSQELMYNLDLNLRRTFNQGYIEFIQRDDVSVLMKSKQYLKAQSTAIDATMENILAKSYKSVDNAGIAHIASLIEDFRRLPVIGINIPFGRFFNNTIATMSEYSGATALMKPFVKGVGDNKSIGQLMSKAAVGWGFMATLVDTEAEYIKLGLAWDESIDEKTGEVVSEKLDFPYSAVKGMARRFAYSNMVPGLREKAVGLDVPEELMADFYATQLGSLTRQLNDTEDTMFKIGKSLFLGETTEAFSGLTEMMQSTGATAASGFSRFLEPVNVAVSLSADPEDYVIKDNKQGREYILKSLRYVDQFYGAVGLGEGLEKKYSATEEYKSRQPAKVFGVRDLPPTTATAQAFNMVGRPLWKSEFYGSEAASTNVVNKIANPILEQEMMLLVRDEKFRSAPTDVKERRFKASLSLAKEKTLAYLENSISPRNKELKIIFDLTKTGTGGTVESLEGAMKELDMPPELTLEELEYPQLIMLQEFLKNRGQIREDISRR